MQICPGLIVMCGMLGFENLPPIPSRLKSLPKLLSQLILSPSLYCMWVNGRIFIHPISLEPTHVDKEVTQKRAKVARPLHTNMPHVKSHSNISVRSQHWLHKLGFLSTSPPYQLAKVELKGPSLQRDNGLKVRQCSHVERGEPSVPRIFWQYYVHVMSQNDDFGFFLKKNSFVVVLLLISM